MKNKQSIEVRFENGTTITFDEGSVHLDALFAQLGKVASISDNPEARVKDASLGHLARALRDRANRQLVFFDCDTLSVLNRLSEHS